MDLLTHLQNQGLISPEIHQSIAEGAAAGNIDIESSLIEAGVDKAQLRTQIAAYYQIPEFTPENDTNIQQSVLEHLPYDSAQHYHIIPLKVEDNVLYVGVNDPEDLRIKEVLSFVSSKYDIPYKFVFLLNEDLDKLLKQYENLSGEVDEALNSLESELNQDISDKNNAEKEETKLTNEHIKEDAPVTRIVATVLRYAIDGGASDIHIEPNDKKVGVRFRVDGILVKSLELPLKVQSAVVARIKILSSLRLDEKRKPQDGRFSATFDNRKIDFRVSVFPTNYGEKVVMRILDTGTGVKSLEDTGVSKHHLQIIRRIIEEPYGIILISGPTGSGKSTTLYTMLQEVDRQTKNVLSLEDPIEYNIAGVSQSQVRPEIGFTFANGLRSALRQDPDVILVGEIRDKETAQLAIQAALTGHLVFSTIHTNNSIGVVARLVDMGIDPYLIAPTLKLAIAQRLARRIYPDSGREEPVDESFKQMMSREFQSLPDRFRDIIPEMNTIVHPESTPTSTSGMKGRIAIMETLEISQEIQSLILNGAGEAEIYKSARKEGFLSMKEDAIIKALDKEIPLQEVSMFGTKVGEERSISGEYLPIDSEEASQSDENVTSKDEIENSETIPAESNEPISIESMEAEVTEDRNPIENPAAAQGSIVPVDNLKPKR